MRLRKQYRSSGVSFQRGDALHQVSFRVVLFCLIESLVIKNNTLLLGALSLNYRVFSLPVQWRKKHSIISICCICIRWKINSSIFLLKMCCKSLGRSQWNPKIGRQFY